MVSQMQEILNQTNDLWQRTFASEDVRTEGHTVGHIVTSCSFHDEIFFYTVFCYVCLRVSYLWVHRAKGRYEGMGRWGA